MKYKIKNKYLSNKIKNFIIFLGLILLMSLWNYTPIIITTALGLEYNKLSLTTKVIYIIICNLIFIAFLIKINKQDLINNAKTFFNKKNIITNIKQSLKYWYKGVIIMIISNTLINIINNGDIATNEETVRLLIEEVPLYMAFNIIIYAPITEELIFRKALSKSFSNKYLYIIASGLLFGGLHVISEINNWKQLLYIIPYASLGIAFASLYKKSNNIFSTIFTHSFHNTLTLLLLLLW